MPRNKPRANVAHVFRSCHNAPVFPFSDILPVFGRALSNRLTCAAHAQLRAPVLVWNIPLIRRLPRPIGRPPRLLSLYHTPHRRAREQTIPTMLDMVLPTGQAVCSTFTVRCAPRLPWRSHGSRIASRRVLLRILGATCVFKLSELGPSPANAFHTALARCSHTQARPIRPCSSVALRCDLELATKPDL